jgi:hypothetical protein
MTQNLGNTEYNGDIGENYDLLRSRITACNNLHTEACLSVPVDKRHQNQIPD